MAFILRTVACLTVISSLVSVSGRGVFSAFRFRRHHQTKNAEAVLPFHHTSLPGRELRQLWEETLLREQDKICDALELIELYHRESFSKDKGSVDKELLEEAIRSILLPPLSSQVDSVNNILDEGLGDLGYEVQLQSGQNIVPENPLFDADGDIAPLTDDFLESRSEKGLFTPYSGWYSKNKIFYQDSWERPGGGGGRTRVMAAKNMPVRVLTENNKFADLTVFEKGGVNVSVVYGMLPRSAARQMNLKFRSSTLQNSGEEFYKFYAAGLSLVLHPSNPMCPTSHANFRYFQIFDNKNNLVKQFVTTDDENPSTLTWWFGGGADLTPFYLFDEDNQHFHSIFKAAADHFNLLYYPRFKHWCDEYFTQHHRKPTDPNLLARLKTAGNIPGERRGVGGIFFDDLNDITSPGSPTTATQIMNFCSESLRSFRSAYFPIVLKRRRLPYSESQKRWQQIRRGRYVEFNLLHDRGTKFGLQTPNARIDSILMSLPLTACWEYSDKHSVKTVGLAEHSAKTPNNSKASKKAFSEDALLEVLHEPREWVRVDPTKRQIALHNWLPPKEL